MPRRGRSQHREIEPDPRFNSQLLAKFINRLMQRGKKSVARRIVYNALELIEERFHKNPVEVFDQAIKNVTPVLEVRPRRVGGATYQVPLEIRGDRRQSLAIRWLLLAAQTRGGKSMADKLAQELWDASQGTGAAVKKKDDTHRMAEANKAFAHFRW